MRKHNHDHHRDPKQQQAQDALPGGRLHVNGAQDGPVSPATGGKGGGGNKSPPGGNGKAPPGNGAEGGRNLRERVTALETEHKHLATKADLEKGLSGLRTELHATETRLSKEIQDVKEDLTQKIQENKEELRKEAQENKEELRGEIQGVKDDLHTELRKMPFRLVACAGGHRMAARDAWVSVIPRRGAYYQGMEVCRAR